MNAYSASGEHGATKSQQTRAAWKVLLRRPLAIAILLTLFPVVPAVVGLLGTGSGGSQRSNIPSYAGAGKRLRDTDDIRSYFESGRTDSSIVGIDFTRSVSIDYREGSSYLMLRRVRSGASGAQIAESVPFEAAGKLMLQFPNLKWIRFTGQQLRKTSPNVLSKLRKLQTIEFNTTDVHAADVERLSQVPSLRHIKITALWCAVNLSSLKALPKLQSVHLTSESMSSSAKGIPLVSRQHVAELAQLPHLNELILESGTVLTDTLLYRKVLTEAESLAVADFAKLLTPANRLRTLYVGYQNNTAKRQALRELRAALPRVSVRPAWYNFDLGGMFNASCFACLFCVGLSGLHFASCCSLPQTGLVPGVQSAHLRVFARLVLIAITCQVFFLVVVADAHFVAATAVSFVVAAMTLMIFQRAYVEVSVLKRQNNLFGMLIGLLPAVAVFGVMGLTDRLEWFMVGEQPLLASFLIATSLFMFCRIWPGLRGVYRHWAENGLEPAVAMQEFMGTVNGHRQKALAGSRLERVAAAWSHRLQVLHDAMKSTGSLVQSMQLWSMGASQVSFSQILIRLMLVVPAICVPMLIVGYVKEGVLVKPPFVVFAPMVGWLLVIIMGVIGVSLYGRSSMFACEILRPVRRHTWRDSVLLTTLLVSVVLGVWSCVIVYAMRIAFGDGIDVVWAVCSFLGAVAFSVVGAALMSWIVIVRRMLFTILCLVLLIAAAVPVTAVLTEGRGFSSSFPAPGFWLCVIAVEAAFGLLLFAFAWRSWTTMELARS